MDETVFIDFEDGKFRAPKEYEKILKHKYGDYMKNVVIFVIGLLFGLVNYSVQNGINFKEAIKQEKNYLLVPILIMNLCNTCHFSRNEIK